MFEDKVFMIFSEYECLYGPEEYGDKNLVTLKIIDGLRELEWEVNKKTEKLKSNNIIKMLQKICQLNKFSINIFEDDEVIEQQIEYTNEKNILLLISAALNWESPQNIKIFGNKNFMSLNEELIQLLSVEMKNHNNDLLILREYLIKFKNNGMDKNSMLENLEKLRSRSDSEETEDILLDLMDFVAGWCNPSASIF